MTFDSVLNTVTHTPAAGSGSTSDSFNNAAGNYVVVGAVLRSSGGASLTPPTYGGQTMTLLATQAESGGPNTLSYLWGLANPPVGANNIVIPYTVTGGGSEIRVGAVSYTLAKQTGQPDATALYTGTGAASFSNSITTIANNCWTILWMWNEASNNSAGSGSTARGSAANPQFFDSNGPVTPAGAKTMGASWSGSSTWNALMVSIAPAVAATGGAFFGAAGQQ